MSRRPRPGRPLAPGGQALRRTLARRPDLLGGRLDADDEALLREFPEPEPANVASTVPRSRSSPMNATDLVDRTQLRDDIPDSPPATP